MKDDFIYKALPNVPKDFADSLYKKISADTVSSVEPSRQSKRISFRLSYLALAILTAVLLVAWSQIRLLVRYVPVGDLWLVEIAQTQITSGDQLATPFVPTPEPPPTIIFEGESYEVWKLETLVPDWTPDDFYKIEIPASMIAREETIGLWSNDANEKIRLYAAPKAGGMNPYAPPGMYDEVQINGQPAILIYGRLALKKPEEDSRKWDRTLGFQLSWSYGESIYTLETFGLYLSEQDLIRMAESMKAVPQWSP